MGRLDEHKEEDDDHDGQEEVSVGDIGHIFQAGGMVESLSRVDAIAGCCPDVCAVETV